MFNKLLYLKKKKKYFGHSKKHNFSFFILRSLQTVFIQKKNFESSRRFFSRKLRKKVKFSIPKKSFKLPTFKKAPKSRMGKGKGKFFIWLWLIHKNQRLFEFSYLKKKKIILSLFKKITKKISMKFFVTY